MSEFRRDRTSGAWVIVAPERGRRPQERPAASATRPNAPIRDPSCPFCPGNEHLLPGIIHEVQAEAPPGWSVRVVPNKYPALQPEDGPLPTEQSSVLLPGFGYHEVIIETPRHDLDFSDLAAPQLCTVLETYRSRYRALAARPGIKSVIVFRNRGGGAGASQRHPHSQVIAAGMVPPGLAAKAEWAREWRDRTGGQCPICEELRAEESDATRLIEATDRFLVFVPFAATAPYENRIFPKLHQSSFAQIDDNELAEFGALLQRAIRRLDALLGWQPYNWAIESAIGSAVDAPLSHWHLRLVANLTRPGGFELVSGMPINPSLPEEDAEALRAVSVPDLRPARPDSIPENDDEATLER